MRRTTVTKVYVSRAALAVLTVLAAVGIGVCAAVKHKRRLTHNV